MQEGRVDYFESISNISMVVDVDFHDIELVIGELEVLLQERSKLLARTAPAVSSQPVNQWSWIEGNNSFTLRRNR